MRKILIAAIAIGGIAAAVVDAVPANSATSYVQELAAAPTEPPAPDPVPTVAPPITEVQQLVEAPTVPPTTTTTIAGPSEAKDFAGIRSRGIHPAIRATWPVQYQRQAHRVATCESRLNPRAKNKKSSASGMFQIVRGTWRRYGRGNIWNAYDNSAAAYRIFRASGNSWRQWQCKPW